MNLLGPKTKVTDPDTLRLAIPFDLNSADLTTTAKRQLDELGSSLSSAELAAVSIELAGHTNERGSADYNFELSRRRVESAKQYLVGKFRIDVARISAVGYGKTRPIIAGARTLAEHATNRRVEIERLAEESETPLESHAVESMPTQSESLTLQWGVLRVSENDRLELVNYDGSSCLPSAKSGHKGCLS